MFKELFTEAEWVSFEISDPKHVKYKTGYQGKQGFKSKSDALSAWGPDSESSDYVAMTKKDYEKKYGDLK